MPSEPRWETPRAVHITCAPDSSLPPGKESTMAIAFKLSDICDPYETFVLSIISELMVDGPNAPFYNSLLEAQLGLSYVNGTGVYFHNDVLCKSSVSLFVEKAWRGIART